MSAAIEALLVFEEVQPLAFGDIMDALKDLQPTLSQALRSVTGFLQINGSFLNTFKVPWPAELRSLLATFGALNLDFVDPDAASRWLGRSMHYGTTLLSNPSPSPIPNPGPNPNPNPSPSPRPDTNPDPNPKPSPDPDPSPNPSPSPKQARLRSGYASPSSSFCWASSSRTAGSSRRACAAATPRGAPHWRYAPPLMNPCPPPHPNPDPNPDPNSDPNPDPNPDPNQDNCVRGAVMCCSILYPVLAARLLALYRVVEFNDLWMLEEDLRLSSDDARPWQMAGKP